MYDQEAKKPSKTDTRHERQADAVGDSHGQHNPVHLCLAMVIAFMLGLWAKEVDNAEIFKMISPAFSTLIGGMIGFLSGIKLMQNEDTKKDTKC